MGPAHKARDDGLGTEISGNRALNPRTFRTPGQQFQSLTGKRTFPVPGARGGRMLSCMIQTLTPTAASAAEWCAQVQTQMMAALDAAWRLAERSDDPTVIARARERAKLCGQFAATARKI